ncbi:ROK family protein [Paenibacillus polysaccharolyticus]|uniref:ROK family transcriptional regulator n=1 Tax=Paenibacillus polysaccharolyticus TaxID=582692 RepID=UPI002040D873|nr:ROK family transcriptional regulator [Paenibacillus polysaccharolyticus]MCM3132293.1 ROK family protein [Paenibacillus polysaccharolyticus]
MAGTPQYIRNLNENLIMDALRAQGTMSRADISRQTGLSKPTVSSAVEHLIGRNLVKETGRADNAQGRKATLIQFNETAYYVCGIDIGATRIRIALSDLNGQIVTYATYPPMDQNMRRMPGPDFVQSPVEAEIEGRHHSFESSEMPVLHVLYSYVDQLLRENGLQWNDIRCIGFGIPGVVLPGSGKISRIVDPLVGMEEDFSRHALARAFPCDVILDNDVNLAALGEYRKGAAKDSPLFIFFSIGAGTGAGIMVQGHLLHGLGGLTGEVAEMRMEDGRRLEDVLSADGLMRLARRHCFKDPFSSDMQPEDIFEGTRRGEEWAINIMNQYSQMIASALRQISTLLAPEMIVLGGGIGGNGDVLLPLLREAAAEQFPVQPQLICSELGERAVVTGAVQVALQQTMLTLQQKGF